MEKNNLIVEFSTVATTQAKHLAVLSASSHGLGLPQPCQRIHGFTWEQSPNPQCNRAAITYLRMHSYYVSHPLPTTQKKRAPKTFNLCDDCKKDVEKIMSNYSQNWHKQEDNYQKFRSQLKSKCNGFNKAILSQTNTPVGFKIVYDWEKATLKVDRKLFNTFIKEHPFSNRTWDTCAVVGNGGILADSGCGRMIDSAQFVFRCNLAPLENGYEKHLGTKTDLVTANPSILKQRYASLMDHRHPFVESLRIYGNSLLLLPAFSFLGSTPICMRAIYAVEDHGSPMRPVYLNPEYFISVKSFWRTQGLKSYRPSSGMVMVSLAFEVCENVHVYGFWPFSNHPYGLYDLKHHYYDDRKPDQGIHAMPAEFGLLMKLHNQGVLKLHLGDC
ncbi:alpha-2,8-sialyltransferase 8E-like [Cheilinus undulatus]|uniref:alpha-2,8-sialyltransferase 8E-like n=1 Tax=Cheilinus undulatus TaxID=241271 RepID=UPI001BD404C6|nr:alpha-2,8-sialyltransferase 8E-like [Cheilinus undulatus]